MKDEDKHNEEMDKLFQGAFAQWEPKPEPAAWDKMEARLNRRRRKRVGILISSILLLGIVGTWYFWPNSRLNKENIVNDSSSANSAKQLNSNITTTVNSSAVSSVKDSKEPVTNTNTQVQPSTSHTISAENKSNTPSAKVMSSETNTTSSIQANDNRTVLTKKKKNTNYVVVPKSIAMNSGSSTATGSHKKNKTVSEKSNAVNQNVAGKSEINVSETKKDAQQSTTTVTNNPSVVSNSNETDANVADNKNKQSTTTLPATKDTTTSIVITAANKAVMESSDLKQDKKQAEKNSNTEVIKKDSAIQNAYAVAKKDSTVKQNGEQHKLSVSIYGSPEIGENNVTSTNAQFNIQDARSTVRISAGAKLNIKLSDNFELNIGLSYSQYNQSNKVDSAWLVKSDSIPYVFATSLGNMSIPDSSMIPSGIIFFQPRSKFGVAYKYTETVSFINMPINAKYTFGNGKLRPYITAGLNLQYVLSEKASLEVIREYSSSQIIDQHFTYNSLDVTKFNFGPSAGAGLEYILTDRLDIYLEPNARLNMLHFSSSANSTNYFIGCQAGVRIGL